MNNVKIESSWFDLLKEEFDKDYFSTLSKVVRAEYKSKTIFPHPNLIFNAFNLTPVDKVKVVILGQDPYHGPSQAHGLCFSVNDGIKHPPSLVNIFKEVESDLGRETPKSGNLERWAKQGVLLLNSTLTVEGGRANSHKDIGWTIFTDRAVELLSKHTESLVFILWGAYAQKKVSLISNNNNHYILKSVHPSPLSAYNGFFGSKHFSKANLFLQNNQKDKILW